MEDLCFGTWRFLLLGDPFDCPELDRVHVKLVRELKQKLKYEALENLVQIFLSAKYELEIENWIAQLLAYRGCFARGNWEPRSFSACLSVEEVKDNISDSSYKLILKAIRELEEKHFNRRSIVLVLDADMQVCFDFEASCVSLFSLSGLLTMLNTLSVYRISKRWMLDT